MTAYWPCLGVLLLARAADLGSTFAVTPDLRGELNPVIRWMGWRATIALNALACPLVALWPPVALFVAGGSLVLALLNCAMLFHGWRFWAWLVSVAALEWAGILFCSGPAYDFVGGAVTALLILVVIACWKTFQ